MRPIMAQFDGLHAVHALHRQAEWRINGDESMSMAARSGVAPLLLDSCREMPSETVSPEG